MLSSSRLKTSRKQAEKKDKSRLAISKKKQRTYRDEQGESQLEGGVPLALDKVRVGSVRDRDRGYRGKEKGRAKGGQEKEVGGGRERVFASLLRIKERLDDQKKKTREKAEQVGRIGDIEKTWRALVSQHHHCGTRRWDKPDRGLIRSVMQTYPSPKDFLSLLAWSVENWSHVVTNSFKWLKRSAPPDHPDPRFFGRFHETFWKSRAANRERKFTLDDQDVEQMKKFTKAVRSEPPKVKTSKVKLRRADLGGSSMIPNQPQKFVWRDTDD